MGNKQAHLQMIQGVINRMGSNSFALKGWSVVLVSALFALTAAGSNKYFALLAYFPTVVFWILDGYFLRQERLFRALYDNIRVTDESNIDFSMHTKAVKEKVGCWLRVTFSKTLFVFHGAILLTISIVVYKVFFIH